MLAPIAVVEARDLDAISAGMDKAIVADINADMGNSWTVRIFKEYQISWLRRADRKGTCVIADCVRPRDRDSCTVVDIV